MAEAMLRPVQDTDPEKMAVDPVVGEAMKRWKRVSEIEAVARERFIDDIKFAEADSDNAYQWPQAIKRNRDFDKRPCLTINLTRQHNLQIINEMKQNKASIKIRAVGGQATVDSANLIAALIRNIEYRSDAQAAYQNAGSFMVKGGIGWFRLHTQYISNDTFDQEIRILPIWDPLTVSADPDTLQADKTDMKWAFVFDLVTLDQFWQMYPEYEGMVSLSPLGVDGGDMDWVNDEYVRVAEYWRKVPKKDQLVSFVDPTDQLRKTLLKSKMPKEVFEALKDAPLTKTRAVEHENVEWYLIVGEEIADKTEWPGKYIPLVRMIGEETKIENILDWKGHTRSMKDSQRMYNYNASAQVEFVALQSKTPFIASAQAIENYETMWNTANVQNHSVLIYNAFDEDVPDKPLEMPQRTQPPTSSPGFENGMQTAFNQMMMASGQWQNAMGMAGNERTGKAIQERMAQADTSVYHYQNNYEAALRTGGKMILDLIPKVMDTKRMLRLAAEDGEDMPITLDPSSPQVLTTLMAANGAVVTRVLNPKIGEYDVEADVGASYGTRREETVQALTLVLTQAPGLTGIIGDLLLRAMDFKEAQEAAARLKRMVPPQALGIGPTPNEQALQAKLTAATSALAKALQDTGKKDLKLTGKAEMRDIDAYKAHTERVAALKDLLSDDPAVLQQLLQELGDDTLSETLRPIIEANKKSLEAEQAEGEPGVTDSSVAATEEPPMPGAKKAPDGEWYILDPTRKSKYLRIGPLAEQRTSPGQGV